MVVDSARVGGSARVGDSAVVGGSARVGGSAVVGGSARVGGSADILTISPIGSRNDCVTFFRCDDSKIHVAVGCFRGTIDEFAAAVQETHGDNEHAQAYNLAIQLAKLKMEGKR